MSDQQTRARNVMIADKRLEISVQESSRMRTRLVVQPSGAIELRVPAGTADPWIDEFMRRRARWIIRQLDYFESFRPRDPERQYRSGETIRYLGRQYRLKVIRAESSRAKMHGRFLVVGTPEPASTSAVRQLVRTWYRDRAEAVVHTRFEECLQAVQPHGIPRPPVQLRRMKRRWGSCSPAGRILLNPDLMIAPVDCIDYVVTHELCHLRHGYHNHSFYRLLTTVMPDWQRRKERLERLGRHLMP